MAPMMMTATCSAMSDAYPHWLFDGSPIADPFGYGERAVKFCRANRHPASVSPKRAFELLDWQERIVRAVYGPRHPDGSRIVKNAVIMLPRGARKTSLGAILANLHLYGPEKVNAGQVILAAYDRDQARIAFEEAAGIILDHPAVRSRTKILDSRHIIRDRKSRSILRAVSSDARAQNGRTPNFVLLDEIHAWKKPDLYGVLRTGLSKTKGSLQVVISQAGKGQDNIAFEIFKYARRVALGEIIDPGTLPILLETPSDADWRDESVWHRVNPGLAVGFPDIDAMRQEATEAEHTPYMLAKFKNDHLNIWLDHSTAPLFDMATYDALAREIDDNDLIELPCHVGVDLALNGDLTAIVAAWRHDDGAITIKPWFYLPNDGLDERALRDGVPYVEWQAEGYLNTTPGAVTDLDMVEDFIRELCATYNVQELVFDRMFGRTMMQRLYDDGLPAIEHGQHIAAMAPAIAELERAVLGGTLRHTGHPILRQHFDSVAVTVGDTDVKRLHKAKRADHIDGAVAAAMAVGRAAVANDNSYRGYFASAEAA
jgi:phage terminase large subunit-like protein